MTDQSEPMISDVLEAIAALDGKVDELGALTAAINGLTIAVEGLGRNVAAVLACVAPATAGAEEPPARPRKHTATTQVESDVAPPRSRRRRGTQQDRG